MPLAKLGALNDYNTHCRILLNISIACFTKWCYFLIASTCIHVYMYTCIHVYIYLHIYIIDLTVGFETNLESNAQ